MEKLNELELNAIEDAWLMPAMTDSDQLDRARAISDVKFWLEHRLEFETDQWLTL